MKPWAFLLACLLAATAINFGLDLRQRTQIQNVSASLASLTPTAEAETDFERRLSLANDPDAFRQLARAQRAKGENSRRLASLLTDSFCQMIDAAILRSGLTLAISLSLAVAARPVFSGRQRDR